MAYSYLTSAKGNALSGAVTSAIDTTGADLLVLVIACQTSYNTTPTDSKSNTWTQLTSYTNAEPRVRVWYCKPTSVGASHTFTAPGSVVGTIFAAAFSGGKTTSPFDQQNGANNFASTLGTGSITPTENDELIIAGLSVNSAGATPITINESMTVIQSADFVGGTSYGGAIAYKIQTTATAISPTWTRSNSNGNAGTVISFKNEPAAGGGPAGLKTINGLAKASVKTINGLALASVKTINGLS